MASDNRGLRRTQGPARIPLGVSRAEVESARTDPMDVMVPVADLAEAMNMDRSIAVRRLAQLGYNVLHVIDDRRGYRKWVSAISRAEAERFIKSVGTSRDKRKFADRSEIEQMV